MARMVLEHERVIAEDELELALPELSLKHGIARQAGITGPVRLRRLMQDLKKHAAG